MLVSRLIVSVLIVSVGTLAVHGALYDLVEANGIASGYVDVGQGRLVVYQASGQRTYFAREPRYDSPDGQYVGFFNFELNRIVRFPRMGRGYLQAADLDDAVPRFRNSRYAVRPKVGAPPAGHGAAVIYPPVVGYPSVVRGYRGHRYPGYLPRLPQSVLIDSNIVANPPLAPVRVTFGNDGPREIQIAVVDHKDPGGTRDARIAPGSGVTYELQRDAGGRRVAHYRVVAPTGDSYVKEVVTDVPPTDRYEVVVHEWGVQSVVIDRTGKSPNKVSDVNFQGKGIGRFMLPPGRELKSGTIDVYSAAKRQGNQGSVGPIVPPESQPEGVGSPLDRAIFEAQREAQRAAQGR